MLRKIVIKNYRGLRKFKMDFDHDLNIVVGNNDVGKSTLLEAIYLALSGRVADGPFAAALCPHFINRAASGEYLEALEAGERPPPPEVLIDLFLEDDDRLTALKGTNNADLEDVPGLRIRASLSADHQEEYDALVEDPEDRPTAVPTEYYRCEWLSFAGRGITARSVPVSCIMLDASQLRLHAGADYQVRRLVREHLTPQERAALGLLYRQLHLGFSERELAKKINEPLEEMDFSLPGDAKLRFALDPTARGGWESALLPHLDDLPLRFVGKGRQSIIKTLLSLDRRTAASAAAPGEEETLAPDPMRVVLIEEPENHLAHGLLRQMVDTLAKRTEGAQLVATTHSSFVLNKLGAEHLRLMTPVGVNSFDHLKAETYRFFQKLPGYHSLRAILCKRVILVEGPSDELVVQRAYRDVHGRDALEDEVEVISVGTAHKRFAALLRGLKIRVDIVVDNDGQPRSHHEKRFDGFVDGKSIHLRIGAVDDGETLEPQLITSAGLELLNEVFGKEFESDTEMASYMENHKTACALKVYESTETVAMPEYIQEAVAQ